MRLTRKFIAACLLLLATSCGTLAPAVAGMDTQHTKR